MSGPIKVFEDNLGVIAMCSSDMYTRRSRHIDLRHHYIRALVAEKIVELKYIPSSEQVADMLTKGLGYAIFKTHCDNLGLRRWSEFK